MNRDTKHFGAESFFWENWRRFRLIYLGQRIWWLFKPKKKEIWFDERLLLMLRCPISHQSLRWLAEEEVPRLEAALAVGALCNRHGDLVRGPITRGLVREDGRHLYWIKQEIVTLTKSGAIRLLWN